MCTYMNIGKVKLLIMFMVQSSVLPCVTVASSDPKVQFLFPQHQDMPRGTHPSRKVHVRDDH